MVFLELFLQTVEKHFMVGHRFTYYVFTNQLPAGPHVPLREGRKVVVLEVPGTPCREDVSMQSTYSLSHQLDSPPSRPAHLQGQEQAIMKYRGHAPCGLRFRQNPPGSGRIVGGQDATIGAWPWMVSLQVFTSHNNRRYHACGGTLLNSHWLLTAAHCFVSKKKVYDWRLIFGAREIVYGNDKPAKPPQQESYVEKIIIHEEYIPSLEHNDIALMKITPPVPCGQFIGMGCLPQFRADPPRFPPACWVIGWGFLKEK
uniref:acrosin-like n=1 Tax=Odobenus rosmarus divergens TaxID=9708 RepID=UPI00063C8621